MDAALGTGTCCHQLLQLLLGLVPLCRVGHRSGQLGSPGVTDLQRASFFLHTEPAGLVVTILSQKLLDLELLELLELKVALATGWWLSSLT